MKTLFLTLILSLFVLGQLAAQGCSTFECALQAAEKLLNNSNAKDKYEKILANLDDADDFAGSDVNKKNQVKALRKKTLAAIQKEKERADQLLLVAEKNTRAAENVAIAVAQSKTDPTLALQMLHYNRQRHPGNLPTLISYYQLLSDTIHPFYFAAASPGSQRNFEFIQEGQKLFMDGDLYDPLAAPDSFPGKKIASLPEYNSTYPAFSADGQMVIVGKNDTTQIWNLSTGKIFRQYGLDSDVTYNTISASKKFALAVTESKRITCTDLEKDVALFDMQRQDPVYKAHFYADSILAIADKEQITLYSLQNGKEIKTIQLQEGHSFIPVLAFSPTAWMAAYGSSEGVIILYDLQTGQVTKEIYAHREGINDIQFSEDGKQVISCCGYMYSADFSARLFDVKTGKMLRELLNGEAANAFIDFSNQAALAITQDQMSYYAWNLQTNRKLTDFKTDTFPIGFVRKLPDENRWIVADMNGVWGTWDNVQQKLTGTHRFSTDSVICIALSPDNHTWYLGTQNGHVQAWDFQSGKLFWDKHIADESITRLFVTPNNRNLLVATPHTLEYRDAIQGNLVRNLLTLNEDGYLYNSLLTADGKGAIVVNQDDETGYYIIKMIQLSSGKLQKELPLAEYGFVFALSATPDGSKVLITSGSMDDGHILVWDLAENRIIRDIYEIRISEQDCAISSDGNTLVTGGGWSHVIRVWNTATGKLLRSFQLEKNGARLSLTTLQLSPDDNMITAGTYEGYVQAFCIDLDCGDGHPGAYPFSLADLRDAGLKLEPEDLRILHRQGVQLSKEELSLIGKDK